MAETKSIPCRGQKPDGDLCGRMTKNPDGYCHDHRGTIDKLLQRGMLKCVECSIKHECEERDRAPNGVCYFDLTRPSRDINSMEDIAFNLKLQIQDNELLRERFNRILGVGNFDRNVSAGLNATSRLILDQYDRYAELMGWKAKASGGRKDQKHKEMLAALKKHDRKVAKSGELLQVEIDPEKIEAAGSEMDDDFDDEELGRSNPDQREMDPDYDEDDAEDQGR